MARSEVRSLINDPYLSFKFRVEIKGIEVAGFSEVSGIQVEIETEDYREGGVNEYIHKLAGPARYPTNLVLKRGLMSATALWDWQQQIAHGNITRHNGSIVLMNSAGEEKWRWNFKDAYPVKWSGPDLRGNGTEVALETLELVHRGLST
ncbi:MAG: phage tail protein [Caldilineaceae bacterium]|nr:phage tail protein [Caldilineaceae bacterium]